MKIVVVIHWRKLGTLSYYTDPYLFHAAKIANLF